MPDPYKALANAIVSQAAAQANKAIQGLASELGTMTASGVKLDRFKHEFKDPLIVESVVDFDIELSLEVPAHDETGQIVLPSIPTSCPAGPGATVAGTYSVTYKFDAWTYSASSQGTIKAKQVRIKHKPELKPGDRVLCALVNGGRDVVIVSKVISYAKAKT